MGPASVKPKDPACARTRAMTRCAAGRNLLSIAYLLMNSSADDDVLQHHQGAGKEVERHSAVTVAPQEAHQVAQANEHHDGNMDVEHVVLANMLIAGMLGAVVREAGQQNEQQPGQSCCRRCK